MDNTPITLSSDFISSLLNNPYEFMTIIDSNGIVRFMSPGSEQLYAVSPKRAIGHHIKDVRPDSKLLRVLQTGKAEIGRVIVVDGKTRIIARIPLKKDGNIIGVAGKLMFSDPIQIKQLHTRIENLENKVRFYKNELNQIYNTRYSFDEIIGESALLKKAKKLAEKAAQSSSPVIITGDSGTGKELFSHAIHQAGERHQQNFIKVNCAAVPNDLIESEMFGYEPGAFSGALNKGKPGKFELAHKGTIFLDEIGDMSLNMQVKMMRVLQEKEVERIGGNKPKRVNFRLISATNQNLEKKTQNGEFRLDLFYRLNVINIKLPSLKEIREDIPLIFNFIVKKLLSEKGRSVPMIAPEVMDALKKYDWPGNVRELKNVAERALIVHKNNHIRIQDLPMILQQAGTKDQPPPLDSLKAILERAEQNAIRNTLKATRNNKAQAAKILKIHRTGLYQKLKKYQLSDIDSN